MKCEKLKILNMKKYAVYIHCVLKVQTYVRMKILSRMYKRFRCALIVVQKCHRRRVNRNVYLMCKQAIIVIQTIAKGWLVHRIERQNRIDMANVLRDDIVLLWEKENTPLVYRSKFFLMIDGYSYLYLAIFEEERKRLIESLSGTYKRIDLITGYSNRAAHPPHTQHTHALRPPHTVHTLNTALVAYSPHTPLAPHPKTTGSPSPHIPHTVTIQTSRAALQSRSGSSSLSPIVWSPSANPLIRSFDGNTDNKVTDKDSNKDSNNSNGNSNTNKGNGDSSNNINNNSSNKTKTPTSTHSKSFLNLRGNSHKDDAAAAVAAQVLANITASNNRAIDMRRLVFLGIPVALPSKTEKRSVFYHM